MKSIKLLIIVSIVFITQQSFGQKSINDFVMTWEGRDSVVHIPVSSSYTYNYDIDWDDDGVFDDFGVTDSISHKYNYVGTYLGMFNRYTIRIRGVFPSIKFQRKSNSSKILFVHQWGDILIKDFTEAFKNSSDLEISATDAPNFDTTLNVSCESAFRGVSLFSGLLDHWDMSSITNMRSMFEGAAAFDSTIHFNSWDVSNVTTMENMFKGCANLEADLHSWDVSSVSNMSGMFDGADNVIGDVSSWNVGNVTNMSKMFRGINLFVSGKTLNLSGWDVSAVTDMSRMFNDNHYIISSLRNWDVSSVTTMEGMFSGCREINQNFGVWNISSVSDMTDMLDVWNWGGPNNHGLSVLNYDSTLMGWAQNVHLMNVPLGAENLEYCMSINARNQLVNDGWLITGDTTTCVTSISEVGLEKVSIYPNPTSALLNFEHLNFNGEIEIYSSDGKLIDSKRLIKSQMNLAELENGVYFLKIGKGIKRVIIFK